MMIDPETFYEESLKGKSIKELTKVIDSLEREIERLKRVLERPDYDEIKRMCPSAVVQLSVMQDNILRAQMALMELDK